VVIEQAVETQLTEQEVVGGAAARGVAMQHAVDHRGRSEASVPVPRMRHSEMARALAAGLYRVLVPLAAPGGAISSLADGSFGIIIRSAAVTPRPRTLRSSHCRVLWPAHLGGDDGWSIARARMLSKRLVAGDG
jgi:hypothetical protein